MSDKNATRRLARWDVLAAGLVLSAAVAVLIWQAPWQSGTSLVASGDCPPGYRLQDPVAYAREFNGRLSDEHVAKIHEIFGEQVCAYGRLPETLTDIDRWGSVAQQAAAAPLSHVPPGAGRAAFEQKQAMVSLQAKVANADGVWENYGSGPQIALDEYVDGSRDGIPSVAGRVDDFAYDEAGKRLFAAVGTGGVWMSEAVDGDVGTLADHWIDIGKNMPTTVASAVAWTNWQGGRLLILTGEHVQGGNTYVGLGAFWSDDLGETWHQAEGAPDAVGASTLAVDKAHPNIVYAATHKGLFRSTDGGESYVNVNLPVSEDCAGVVEYDGPCQLANVVTDVVVQAPGGTSALGLDTVLGPGVVCEAAGCSVLAAVGYRGGNGATYADGTSHAPGNGLYRSPTGEPGTFVRIDSPAPLDAVTGGILPLGFAPQSRIGRIELGAAIGPEQDHNYVYAIVQDAVLLNGGFPLLDLPTEEGLAIPLDCGSLIPENVDDVYRDLCEILLGSLNPTTINGLYVSPDFGETWTRLADDINLTYTTQASGSTLAVVVPLGIGPGVQAWYDLWVQPDPTLQDVALHAPTRVVFGMEEVWKNTLSGLPPVPIIDQVIDDLAAELGLEAALEELSLGLLPVVGLVEQLPVLDWEVFGTYFAGETCLYLIGQIGPAVPICPTYDGLINGTTTHPDQHDGIFIPDDERGGVWLIVGNDGGVYKQYSSNPITDDFANNKWGDGANEGFYTLMNYGISVAKDGTVFYGLQDNSSGKIEPGTGRQIRTYVGDGMWTAVDPDNSAVAYVQTPGLALVRTTDGGRTHDYVDAPSAAVGTAHFLSPFMMDPTDADHLVAVGTKVGATLDASTGPTWMELFDLGIDEATGVAHQARHRSIDVQGANIYAGWCGPCSNIGGNSPFQRGLATNVGGDAPPQKGSPDGWHQATMAGLPNRFIYGVEMDDEHPEEVYVTLGGYNTVRWVDPGSYLDENPNIGEGHVFKSTDAGESFVDISGNLPDTPVTAILKRGGQLIVGTDLGVFISSDLDGTEWAPLGDLENVPVNQLALHPGDDRQLFAATFGRGVKLYSFDTTVADEPDDGAGEDPATSGGTGGAPGGWLLAGLGLAALWRRRAASGRSSLR